MSKVTDRLKKGLLLTPFIFSICLLPIQADCADNENWGFQLAPYGWLAGQKGQIGTLPGLPPADVDVDFYDDIWGDINGAIMLIGQARKGNFGLFVDIFYIDIETE
jgi:hypothetical protein